MTRRVLVVQHVPWEGPGRIATALADRGAEVDIRPSAELARAVPDLGDYAGLVLMGGPMRATDDARHPGLPVERELVRRAVGGGMPVLGVCLGHQLIGLALGGSLDAGVPEIGVGSVDVGAESVLGPAGTVAPVLHWHGDVVSLPDGAALLASTDACANQAFRAGSALAMQFHLELDERMLRAWLSVPAMRAEAGDPVALREAFRRTAAEREALADAVFGGFAEDVVR